MEIQRSPWDEASCISCPVLAEAPCNLWIICSAHAVSDLPCKCCKAHTTRGGCIFAKWGNCYDSFLLFMSVFGKQFEVKSILAADSVTLRSRVVDSHVGQKYVEFEI